MNPLDRAVGTLLGLAVGDAVGTTLEFQRAGHVRADHRHGRRRAVPPDRRASGPTTPRWRCASPSRCSTRGDLDPDDQLRRYVAVVRRPATSARTDAASTSATRRSTQLERFQRTGEPIDPAPDEEAAANGSLMRLGAVPIRWHARPGGGGRARRRVEPHDARGAAAGRRLPADGRDGRAR